MSVIHKPKDLWCGVIFVATAAAAFHFARDYTIGSAARMGPGYFPVMLAGALAVLGGILIVRSLFGERQAWDRFDVVPLLVILGGTLLFGLLLRPAGLIISVLVLVLIGTLATRTVRPVQAILLASTLAAFSSLTFVYLLEQPMPLLGYWFGG